MIMYIMCSTLIPLLDVPCIFVSQIADNGTRSTSYRKGIHCMVTVVNTFLGKSLLFVQRHLGLKNSMAILIIPIPITIGFSHRVESHKPGSNNPIPNIIESPILFEAI